MVAFSIFAKVRGFAGMVAALSSLSVATPALANSAAANADVTAPLRAAQAAKPSVQGGDEDFRNLFNGWKSMDNGQLVLAPASTVAVAASATPSYRPTTGWIRMP